MCVNNFLTGGMDWLPLQECNPRHRWPRHQGWWPGRSRQEEGPLDPEEDLSVKTLLEEELSNLLDPHG